MGIPDHTRQNQRIARLLLIIDDYEKLQEHIGVFLVNHLLPMLQAADFQSVVIILGRDKLDVTNPAWKKSFNADLLHPIDLEPFSRQEMEELVTACGNKEAEEIERAWQDTRGYPFSLISGFKR